jgi:DNA-binding transcriptional regulator YiaG
MRLKKDYGFARAGSVEQMPPVEIKRLRETPNVSQAVFATLLDTSVSTVQKWEVGDKRPGAPLLKLLNCGMVLAKEYGLWL